MTLLEAALLVEAHTRRQTNTAVDTRTLVVSAINMARKEIQGLADLKSTRTTAADSSLAEDAYSITLEENVLKVISPVRLVNPSEANIFYNIPLKSRSYVVNLFPNWQNMTSGAVACCFHNTEDDTLQFAPPTNQAWTVSYDYYQRVVDLVDNAEVLEDGFEQPIVAWASAYVFKSTQQLVSAQFWDAEFAKCFRIALGRDNRDHEDLRMAEFRQDCDKEESVLPPWLDPFNGIPR